MRRRSFALMVLGLFVICGAPGAHANDEKGVTFGKEPVFRSGPEIGQLAASEDGKALGGSYSDFNVHTEKGGKDSDPVATKTATLVWPISGKPKTGEAITFTIEGVAHTLPGASGVVLFSVNDVVTVKTFKTGEKEQSFRAEVKLKPGTAQECRITIFIAASRDSGNADTNGFVQITALDGNIAGPVKKVKK
jgi:hypothetical protein